MSRSRRRKLKRLRAAGLPLASTMLMASPMVFAQEQSTGSGGLEEVVVTAQKRTENLQNVPLSIQAISTQRLEELHVENYDDFFAFLPSVAFQSLGPGFERIYMRGVAAGDNGNHSGSVPSVGVYLDEQPITTITGPLNVHIYDIARVEALAGPQGTLYGASSQAGTIRIITNKPDPSGFSAAYDVQGNQFDHGGAGYTAEGYANLPITDYIAARVVGWVEHDGGYIDNVHGTRTYPVSGITADNAKLVKNNFNDVDTYGARGALRIDLDDSWTITPTLIAQQQKSNGNFGQDNTVGPLEVAHYFPENVKDQWWQAALTVEGKISNFDVTYTGAYLRRNVDSNLDYTDYSFFYDVCCNYGAYVTDNNGNLIDPGQYIHAHDGYVKQSHELRVSTPQDQPLRFVGGLFLQRQSHDILQRYQIANFADSLSVPGWPNTIWLTDQERTDRDRAVFGELSYDITKQLTVTGGARRFTARNSLNGFYGFSANFSSSTGEAACFAPASTPNAPCTNLNKEVSESGWSPKLNATYHFDADKLVYATYSKGFRPGGVNRRGAFPPYNADYLKNYEVGWKTSWLDNHLRVNGAAFVEDWNDFQFAYLGQNGLTNVTNGSAARIRGVEADATWAMSRSFALSGALSLLDSKLTSNFCKDLDDNGQPLSPCPADAFAPNGTQLPITPKFKSNITARYNLPVGRYEGHLQGSVVYQGKSKSELVPAENDLVGEQGAYTLVNLAASLDSGPYTFELFMNNVFDKHGDLYKYTECAILLCGGENYDVVTPPRLLGLKFEQKF